MADSQYHEVDGLYISKSFPVESVRSGLRYQAQPGDLFIVSYPKCGTTWMQHIVYNIINNRPPPRNQLACITEMPFLELQGAEAVEDMRRPGPIKTHLAFPLQPYSSDAKYIYVTRNPYDCCVSFFYHTRDMPDYHFEEGTFDQFFDMFLEGKVDFGDYFDHVLSWYEHRNDPNVLFVTYEQLKENIRSCVLKVADFLGDEFGQKLRNDESCLENVLRNVSLASMKEGINDSMKNVSDGLEFLPGKKMPKWCELVMETVGKETFEKPMKGEFIRKGIVGDWRNHFSAEQVQRLKHKIEERTRGIDIMNIWKDADIPK